MLNPKGILASVGRYIFFVVRWAESGGRHDASWNDLPLDVWFYCKQAMDLFLLGNSLTNDYYYRHLYFICFIISINFFIQWAGK